MDYLKEYAKDNHIKTSDIISFLGYDGVHDGSEWVAFSSEQLKSADPVTYDDNGNVIPLSERFKEDNADFRYSKDDTIYDDDILFTSDGGLSFEESESGINVANLV